MNKMKRKSTVCYIPWTHSIEWNWNQLRVESISVWRPLRSKHPVELNQQTTPVQWPVHVKCLRTESTCTGNLCQPNTSQSGIIGQPHCTDQWQSNIYQNRINRQPLSDISVCQIHENIINGQSLCNNQWQPNICIRIESTDSLCLLISACQILQRI